MASCKLSGQVFQQAGSLSKCMGVLSFPTPSCTLTPPPPAPAHVSPPSAGLYVETTAVSCSCEKLYSFSHTNLERFSADRVAMETKLRYIINPARHQRQCGVCRPKSQSVVYSGSEHCKLTSKAPPILTDLWNSAEASSRTSYIPQVGGTGHVTSSMALASLRDGGYVRGEVLCAEASQQPVSPQQQQEELQQRRGQGGEDLPSPAQLSFILLKLREELPSFFTGHHTYSMYSPNLVFTNNLLLPFSWSLYSRWSYRCFLAACRGLLRVRCTQLRLDLLRITKTVDSGRIEARWRLRGKPRLRFKERVILDGYSEFVVNSNGVISRHKMDCMMPAQQKAVERKESLFPSPLNLLPKQALPEN